MQPVKPLPTTVKRIWWKHNSNLMCVEIVVATGMVELEQVTNCGCVPHEVKHAMCVVSRTTS